MSGYILCQIPRAVRPFHIENISTNIYSLEELCYYLYHNLYLVDRSIINESLCSWLEEELSLPRLAQKLRGHLGKFAELEDVLYPVFKEINYLSYEELRDLNGKLQKMDKESKRTHQKKKGDALLRNRMYVSAIQVYEELLKEPEFQETEDSGGPSDEDREMKARLLHNLGCAYSRLFQMEKAMECFEKVLMLTGRDEDLITYLLAYRSIRTPIEYESRLTELLVSDEIRRSIQQKLDGFARKPEPEVYVQHVDELIERLTKEYHRSTLS